MSCGFLWHPWYAIYMLHLLANGVTRVPAVAQLDEITDGEVLDVPGSPRVVHAPGHTAGSCALFLEDRSLLFSGDALVNGKSGYTFAFAACDLLTLGTGIGTFSVNLTGPGAFLYTKSAAMTFGYVQIHPH